MRIGFDAKRAVQNYTGLGNYSRYIIKNLCRFYPQNEYILFAPKRRVNEQLSHLFEEYKQIQVVYPMQYIWRKLSSLWRVWRVTSRFTNDGIQIFHGLSNELPINIRKSRIKSVVTIHDLIFLHFPQYYKPIDRKIYTYKFRKACQNANRIIAISECTKRDIIRLFNIPENKIEVIYQGCDESFHKEASAEKKKEVKERYNLPDKYILNVGSIEERKNVLLAVKALKQLPENIHLVIVGKRTPYTQKVDSFIQANKLKDRVHIYSNVSFKDLPAIYQQAEIFVYPSRYEGFGIPMIEALHSGIPAIGATGSCLEEAGGPESSYVDPDNVNELANTFNEILSSPEKRERMIAHGKEYVKRFTDEKLTRQLANVYKQIIS
ncbi:glycosyltransferase family 1 protein [Bacteroides sp. 51]|uniref:glycosyltransferase family 4 protein n=1 Tax=Bacteroides sp. 51 TaxID=2302938 RepID=UPI0013D8D8B9|nr:glycosyltransferase family 1 protein [Bacteroides sp. 51]NDV81497.1 glycosyltransferase family 1 protein [Bacteroides sp. 51]